jgi:HK97 family phage portal protein
VSLISRIFRPPAVRAAEGEYRPGPYFLNDGWLSAVAGRTMNWWQQGYSLQPYGPGSAMVEACIGAYSQTVAMCPGDHWRRLDNGGRERVTTSALSRILRRPNDYQTISDFLLNLTRSLYTCGNAYALAIRNARFEITELHLMRQGWHRISTTGEIFYDLSGNEIIEERLDGPIIVPSRDVLHVRLHTPRHPLKGESPILAAALDIAAGNSAVARQIQLFENKNEASYLLSTDERLTGEQSAALRERWNEQTTGVNRGGTPILSWGLKAQKVDVTAQDSQLVETLKMSAENVALAFRVPLPVLGVTVNGVPSTEILMQSWIASGLGFALNHIEVAFDQLFGISSFPEDYVEFSTSSLLRSAFKDRMEGLAAGVHGGIYAPNEARALEELRAVKDGDEPRVQQQDVPLSYGMNLQPNPQPAPKQLPAPTPEPKDAGDAGQRAYAAFRAHDHFTRH